MATLTELMDQSPFLGSNRRRSMPASAPVSSPGTNLAGVEAYNDAQAHSSGSVRGEGLLTKYRPVGGWQDAPAGGGGNPGGRLAQASEFGEPTSYAGGAGAPAPVEVIKGTRLGYVNATPDNGEGGFTPTPGTGSREFATPLAAGQAYNQGQRGDFLARNPVNPNVTYPTGSSPAEQATAQFGDYREPGQTGREIAAAKEGPGQREERLARQGVLGEQQKALEMTNRQAITTQNQGALQQQLLGEVGISDATGKNISLPADPGFQAIHKKMNSLITQGSSLEDAYSAVAPELHKHYYTPENVNGAIGLMEKQAGQPMTPTMRQQLMSGSPEAMSILYPFTTKAAQQPRGVISRTLSPAPAVGPGQYAPGSNLAQLPDQVTAP